MKQTSQSAPSQIQQIWDAIRPRSPIAMPDDPRSLIAEGVRRALAFVAPRAGTLVADLFAEWKVAPGLTFFGRVENLFDESYETARGYSSLDRSVYFGIRSRL